MSTPVPNRPRRKMTSEETECEKIRKKLLEPRKKKKDGMTKEQRLARLSDPQAMIRAANIRYARLAISNLIPKEKDAFLIDLTDEIDQDEICYQGQRVGEARVLPIAPSRKRNMVDQETQIWPKDFFLFDSEVVPILERLVGAVCSRARREVLEEEELRALKNQREMFEELKRQEEEDYQRYKTRVERHIEEERRLAEMAAKDAKERIWPPQ